MRLKLPNKDELDQLERLTLKPIHHDFVVGAQLSSKDQWRIDRELWKSAEKGHLKEATQALQKGANLQYRHWIGNGNCRYVSDITPHTVAYINGHSAIVHLLENYGAFPDYNEIMLAAAVSGLVDIMKEAIEKNANVNGQDTDDDGDTALHLASGNGHTETVQFLLLSNADPNICNKDGQTPAHYAAEDGQVDALKLLITVERVDVNVTDKWGHSPLHLAHWYGHDNIVNLLCSFGARDIDQVRNDDLLLTSAKKGDIENVVLALASGANVNVHHPMKGQKTALHLASRKGHCDIVQLLLNSNADPNIYDEGQKTALHLASMTSHCDIVQLLLNSNADPNIYDKFKQTPAHYAVKEGHVDALKLLIEVGQVDVNATDKDGNNLLHLACESGSEETVYYLLHDVQLDPDHLVAQNNHEQMPLDRISPSNTNRFQLLKLFQPFKQCHRDYLTESYAKLFLCGKKEAGKSSLAAVISYRADKWYLQDIDPEICVKGVVLQTTGIEYHTVHSREIGNVVIFDFAGHAEYYSSHAAVLETLLLRSPAVFAILSNLTDDDDMIKKDLLFWFNFVENVSMNLISSSQILVLGSHIDELRSEKDFNPFVNDVADLAVRFQNYKGFLPIDCHRPGGRGVNAFMKKLRESCEAIVDKNDKMSYHCHCLNSYLQQLKEVAISLDELCSRLMELNESCLLTDRSTVLELLSILGSKGLILFLANTWVIIDKKALLTDVNGVLFNKTIDRERKPVASNTGVMPVSALANLFPKHNTDMLIRFLTSLQFCHEMNALAVSSITNNVLSDDSALSKDEKFLFFPALITEDKPSQVFETTDGFGWCLWCPESQQFLSMRFLHTLLHRLAFTCCPPPPEEAAFITENLAIQELHRVCIMWKNGIYWKEENIIEVMVEVTEDNRCVTILVSHSSLIESYKLRASLIKEVLSLKSQLCQCTAKQFVIAPGNVKNVIDKEQANRVVYSLREAAKGVLARENVSSTNNEIVNVQLVVGKKEPYLCIVPLLTKALFTDSNKDLQLPDHYVQHIREVCSEIMSSYPSSDFTYFAVREHLNQYSIFAGRNPLSIPSPRIKDEVMQRLSKHVQKGTAKGSTQDDFPKLFERPTRCAVLVQLSSINASWRSIGNGLGVSYNDLQGLAQRNDSDQTRLDHVIEKWFKMNGEGEGAPVIWKTIIEVVKGPLIQDKALAMTIYESLKRENSVQQNTQSSIDPSEIFLEHFADICDAIEVKPLPIVNQLLVAKLISLNLKKDVESMSGDAYDKANKVVNDLQRQVDEKGMAFLKAICCFFLKQKHDLKDIGTRMKSRLKEQFFFEPFFHVYIPDELQVNSP